MASSPGDFTGNKKARLQKEAEKEQQLAAANMAMITAQEKSEKTNEVIDLTKKKKTKPVPTGPVDFTIDEDLEGLTIPQLKDRLDERGLSTEGNKPDLVKRLRQESKPAPVVVEKTSTLVRARFDMKAVTIGHGNTYDFEAGVQYRLPPNAASHLAERDLVDILQ